MTKILVIEDADALRKDILEMLDFEGYSVRGASDGVEGLKYALRIIPDLIVCDIMMPQLDGYGVLSEIRRNPLTNHIAFIFLTARSDKSDVRVGMNSGADDYLTKPFTATELIESIKIRLERTRELNIAAYNRRADFKKDLQILRNKRLLCLTNELFDDQYSTLELIKSLGCKVQVNHVKNFRVAAAKFDPECIVLIDNGYYESVSLLKEFSLTENLPIVLINYFETTSQFNAPIIEAGVDEVCTIIQNQFETNRCKLENYLKSVLQQYKTPDLPHIGAQWKMLAIVKDVPTQNIVTSKSIRDLNFEISLANTAQEGLVHIKNNIVDLILLEVPLSEGGYINYIKVIRIYNYYAPVLLICSGRASDMYCNQFEFDIRGVMDRPLHEPELFWLIKKMQRFGYGLNLLQIWGKYSLIITEQSYRLMFTESLLVGSISEIELRMSGIIHDLRNAQYGITSQINTVLHKLKDNKLGLTKFATSKLKSRCEKVLVCVQCASTVLETLADVRFKGDWRPVEIEQESLYGIIQSCEVLLQQVRPEINLDTKFISNNTRKFLVDREQLRRGIGAILIAIFDETKAPFLLISSKDGESGSVVFTISAKDEIGKNKSLSNIYGIMQTANFKSKGIYLLSAYKILCRHGVTFGTENENLLITLPTESWTNEEWRMNIALLANQKIEIEPTPTTQLLFDNQAEVRHLVQAVVKDIVNIHKKVLALSRHLDVEQSKLSIKAEYALLLSRDLLFAGSVIHTKKVALSIQDIFDKLILLRGDYLKECDIEMKVKKGTPLVQSDELGLLQILINLTTNALEAMSDKDGLLDNAKLVVTAQPHPKGVCIAVQDNGPGILADQLQNIFNLFYTTKLGHERGVGLYIVQSLVNKLNGQIWVESRIGHGTKFIVIIPAQKQSII